MDLPGDFFLSVFSLLTCFQIPVLFISSDIFIEANGILIILPFASGIWRFPTPPPSLLLS